MGFFRNEIVSNFVIVKQSDTMADENSPEIIVLTNREQDVLRLLAKGYTSTRIANELGISQSTVMDYRKKLHRKFNVNRVGELTYKASELHLI